MANSHFTDNVTPTDEDPLDTWLIELHMISESLAFVTEAAPAHCGSLTGLLGLIQAQFRRQLQVGETLLRR